MDVPPRFALRQIWDMGWRRDPATPKRLSPAMAGALGTDLRTTLPDGSLGYDGIVGSQTRAAVERALEEGKIHLVNNRFVNFREAHFRDDARKHPKQRKFLDGWLGRARSFSVSTHPGMPLHRSDPLY